MVELDITGHLIYMLPSVTIWTKQFCACVEVIFGYFKLQILLLLPGHIPVQKHF